MTIEAALRSVAAHGVGSWRGPSRLEGGDADVLVARAAAEGLVGLLDQALADGVLQIPPDKQAQVSARAVEVAGWTLVVERHHLEVHRHLRAAAIDHRFLKGPGSAHRFYEHAALRPFVDVDVLVPGSQIDAAAEVLERAGHRRRQRELGPSYTAKWGKSATLASPDGIEVDVHRTLASGPFGLAGDPGAMWAAPADEVAIGATALPVPAVEAAYVHACVHAVTGARQTLGQLREVVQISRGLEDTGRAQHLADELRVRACVRAAAAAALDVLHVDEPSLVAQAAWPVSRREARWLRCYAEGRSYRSLALAGSMAVPGLRNRLRYVYDLGRWSRRGRGPMTLS